MMSTNGIVNNVDQKINDVKLMIYNHRELNKKHTNESIDVLRHELKNIIHVNETASAKRYDNTQQYIQKLKDQVRFNCNMILAFIVISIVHLILNVIGVL